MVRRLLPGLLLLAACLPERHPLEGRACDEAHPCPDGSLRCLSGRCELPAQGPADGGAPPDAGRPDAGRPDAGPPDAATPDGGAPDGGSLDGGAPDGGSPDAGEGCPNLLGNGGFETGLEGYLPIGAPSPATLVWETVAVRSGQRSVSVRNSGGSSSPSDSFGVRIDRNAIGPADAGVIYCLAAWIQRGHVLADEIEVVPRQYDTPLSSGWDEPPRRYPLPDEGWHRVTHQLTTHPSQAYRIDFRFSATVLPDAGGFFSMDDVRVWSDPTGQCDAGGC